MSDQTDALVEQIVNDAMALTENAGKMVEMAREYRLKTEPLVAGLTTLVEILQAKLKHAETYIEILEAQADGKPVALTKPVVQ